jgi:hypothetical protein
MLSGKKFRLERCTIALDVIDGHRRMVVIPAGQTIEAVSDPTSRDHMVEVLWQGRTLTMFALDVDVPGTEIAEPQHLSLVASA